MDKKAYFLKNKTKFAVNYPFYVQYLLNCINFFKRTFLKDFLKVKQGGGSIHRINKLGTLKPSLAAVVRVLIEVQYKSRSCKLDVFQFCPNYQQPFQTHWSITSGSFIELQNCLTTYEISRNDLSYPLGEVCELHNY